MNRKLKILLIPGALILVLLASVIWMQRAPEIQEVGYSEFLSDLEAGKIVEITIQGRNYVYQRETAAGVEEEK